LKGPKQKRVPAGLPAEHPRAEWLCRTGLYAEIEQPLPAELYTPGFPDFCLDAFSRVASVQQWLVEALPG
jgi:hypothetical protein